MSKPFSRKEFRRRYTALSIGSYLLILFCFAHIGYVLTSQPGTPISPDTIQAVLNHMVYRPLQLWPNQSVYLIYGAICLPRLQSLHPMPEKRISVRAWKADLPNGTKT